MIEKIQKYQRPLLISLIVICMGIMALGAVVYLQKISTKLMDNAIQDVMDVTLQQRQAVENYFSGDRERLRGYAEYLSKTEHDSSEDSQDLLVVFAGMDANFAVICLEENWICSSTYGIVMHSDPEEMDEYHGLSGSGIRDNYVGLTSGVQKFAFYETFAFQNGHPGLVQKSYNRNKVLETFSLSIYDGQGYGYILNSEGDILLRSIWRSGSETYNNVFNALTDTHSDQDDIDAFRASLDAQETGSIVFTGDNGSYIYTFAPIESVDGWHILSIVPVEAIQDEVESILRDSQMIIGFFALMLVICAMFIFLVRRTQKEIKAKELETAYQSQLFDSSFAFLAQNTDDLYLIFDHDTEKLEYVSPNLERVLGITPEELGDCFRAADMAAGSEDAITYYTEVRALRPGEMAKPRSMERINSKTGEHTSFLENAYCIDIQGRKKKVFYFSNRTKERKAQNDLAEALHMAQAANDAKTAFLSSVSHDIRTPMNAIIGFLALMRDEVDNPSSVMEYNKRIDAASQHLLGLINDVLDMSKIESGSATLNISEMDLADVIDEINTIIRAQAKAKGQTFDIVVTHMNFEHLLGDKMRLNQILINLLSNAVKYTPENGSIRLEVEEMPQVVNNYSRVRFTVSDNGMGLSEAYQKVLFEPFTREEDTAFLYERLSRDDNLDGDSYSIQNQKKLLTKVAKEKGYTNLVHFYDDGISGVTMDRPGFVSMLQEIEKGKAAAVFVKDLSRLGRNYIEVGRLTEEFFPEHDIRLVAVSDGIDTDEGENELAPIKNLFNEWYARDISKKRRISNKIKGNSGEPMGQPPYGYQKDPDNPKRWIVDETAAAVVRRIYRMSLDGMGVEQIADALSKEEILTPRFYWQAKGVQRAGKPPKYGPCHWNSSTVTKILTLQEYCGDVLNFKTYSKSYKNKRRIENDRENWAIFKDVHEAIIDRATWEKIQERRGKVRKRRTHEGEKHMFSGLLVCADCGNNLHFHFNQGNPEIEYFNCSNYKGNRGTCSSTHYIRADFLEQVVLAEIRRLTRFVCHYEKEFAALMMGFTQQAAEDERKLIQKELDAAKARDRELDSLFERIYEDNVAGKLSDERFARMSTKYEDEQKELRTKIKTLQEGIERTRSKAVTADMFISSVRKYTRVKKLTPRMLDELVQYIEVHQAEKVNGTWVQRLTIHYNCVGAITIPGALPLPMPDITVNTRKGVYVSYQPDAKAG